MNYLLKIAVLCFLGLNTAVIHAQKDLKKSNDQTEITTAFNSPEYLGNQEANRLARMHGIENPGLINKIKKASVKYFEAKELLEDSYAKEMASRNAMANTPSKGSENRGQGNAYGKLKETQNPLYKNRLEALEAAYSKELRELLPQG